MEPAALTASVGCQVMLSCLDGGSPPSQQFQWSFNAAPLQATARAVVRSNGELLLSGVCVEDSGTYSCTVFGQFSNTTAVGVVTVQDPLFPAPPPPSLPTIASSTPSTQLLPPGQLAQFVCLVGGAPPPQVTWLIDGVEFAGMENDSRLRVVGERVLVVVNVSSEDSRVYTCLASNSKGNSTRDFRLAVTGEHEADLGFDPFPPLSLRPPSPLSPSQLLQCWWCCPRHSRCCSTPS